MTWREKSLFRLTLTCMCISPEAVESRDRHPVYRSLSSAKFLKNGITTVVGLLGTDGVTRSVENLVAKARALTEEGMTVYTLTSSYGYPPTTLTGSVERDIILVPPMIGVKVAVWTTEAPTQAEKS